MARRFGKCSEKHKSGGQSHIFFRLAVRPIFVFPLERRFLVFLASSAPKQPLVIRFVVWQGFFRSGGLVAAASPFIIKSVPIIFLRSAKGERLFL